MTTMDLQPSAPSASASSLPWPTQFQMCTDPLQGFEKLNDLHQGGSSSPSMNPFSKFPFPIFSSSTKAGIGIDLTSERFSASTGAASWGIAAAHNRIRSSTRTYFSPNKIAYPSPGGMGPTPALPSVSSSSSSTLQGSLQRSLLGSSSTLGNQHKNNQRDVSAQPAIISSRITQKIRHLDEILQNLDDHSTAKRFTFVSRKEITEPLLEKLHQRRETGIPMVQDMASEQLARGADDGSGTLGGSVIPDCLTHINKSISRMEFKAQMEKLTNIIEDRWPGSKRVERVERVETKSFANAPSVAESSSARVVQEQTQTQEVPPQSTSMIATNTSATSINFMNKTLKNVAGLEHHSAKQDRSKQSKQKGFLVRGRLWVHRPLGKRMAAMLQKQMRQHAASINQRLDKTDLTIKSLRRQRREAVSPIVKEGNSHGQDKERKVSRVSHSSSKLQPNSLRNNTDISSPASENNLAESGQSTIAEECIEACEALSRNMQHIQDQICTLQSDSQRMGQSLEKIHKQSSEQSMEIELCWTAINHLCIDNETFREELQVYRSGLQQHQLSHGPTS